MLRLDRGAILSHCPRLALAETRTRDGVRHVLIGHPVSGLGGDAVARLAAVDSGDVDDAVAFFAGRWALLSRRRCIADAGGMLGLFHRTVDGVHWLSSSAAILGEHLPGAPRAERIGWDISYERGIDWVPAPFSTREEVRKLLPLRAFDPATGDIRPQAPLPAEGPELAEMLTGIMAAWGRLPARDRVIALTGGFDSRTVLAAATAAGVAFRTYTTRSPGLAYADRTLPPKLARACGVAHRFVGRRAAGPDGQPLRCAVALEQTDGIRNHPIFQAYVEGRLHDVPGMTIAHSHVLDIGRCIFWSRLQRFGATPPSNSAAMIDDLFSGVRPEPYDRWRRALDQWLASLREPSPIPMDWRDRFYHEQRIGAWASGLRLITDLTDGVDFFPADCAWVIRALLEYPVQARRAGVHQKALVRQLMPALARYPVNPMWLGEWARAGWRYTRRRLHALVRYGRSIQVEA